MTYYLVLDLETAPDPAVPYDARPGEQDRCLAAPHHEIVAGAVLTLGIGPGGVVVLGPRLLGEGGDERAIILDALDLIAKHPRLVGWNIRAFDLPVLIARAMRHGVRAPWLWSRDIQDRYRGKLCVDLQDAVSFTGAGRFARMGAFAQMLGWPGKTDMNGSDVAALWARGERKRVQNYVLTDVVQEAAILVRLLHCSGDTDDVAHAAASAALVELLDSRPELASLRGRVDMERWRIAAPSKEAA